jgi:hypothetical protein
MKSAQPFVRPISRRSLLAAAASSGACACVAGLWSSRADALAGDRYSLDDVSRTIVARGRVVCPKIELVTYRGQALPYAQRALIYVDFQARLQAMEAIIVAAAKKTYGRSPKRLLHLGTYNCRRIAAYPTWLSEHGLGNAIDVAGVDFGALERGETLPDGVPRQLRGAFSVRVERHWRRKPSPASQLHATFLRRIIRALLARRDVFRVLLGPGYPGHHNHFHFDCAPFRMVEGFEDL